MHMNVENNTHVCSAEVLENATHVYGLTNMQVHNYSL